MTARAAKASTGRTLPSAAGRRNWSSRSSRPIPRPWSSSSPVSPTPSTGPRRMSRPSSTWPTAARKQGNALADVLFGDYNPAGRLARPGPNRWINCRPMMDYNIRHGRTYMYFKGEPLYPFGFGLSYTTFKYSNLKTSADARQGRHGHRQRRRAEQRQGAPAKRSCSCTSSTSSPRSNGR